MFHPIPQLQLSQGEGEGVLDLMIVAHESCHRQCFAVTLYWGHCVGIHMVKDHHVCGKYRHCRGHCCEMVGVCLMYSS